jgi:hypothetical protein
MNIKTQSIILTSLLFVVGVGAYIISNPSRVIQDNSSTESTNQSEQAKEVDIPATIPDETFSAQEVSKHSSEDDCWTIINNVVFDITPYIPRHPGGEEILRACGQDGSSLFNARRTEDGEKVGFGDEHSQRAASQLADFAIGSLEK